MMTSLAAVLAGAALGLLSAAHCTLMCGPVALVGRAQGRTVSPYFVGRLAAYGALGALAGSVGHVLLRSTWAHHVERVLAVALAGVLLYGAFSRRKELVELGTKPRRNLVGRALARLAHEPLLLGAATALLPCATLFAAVMAAAATGSALAGTSFMLAFATVTGLAVVSAGSLLARLDRRVVLTALVLGSGVWLVRSTVAPTQTCPLHQGASR